MAAAQSLPYAYTYPFASAISEHRGGLGLRLATFDGADESPHFFDAAVRHPAALGRLLLVLSDCVRSSFTPTPAAQRDPVVTAGQGMLRFEGFSSCCGVYVRVDAPSMSFDADVEGRGTTNVDFNDAMRASLAGLRDDDPTRLAVGADEVLLETLGGSVVEKKVTLPARWVKGFSEVQAYQPALRPAIEVPGVAGGRFVRQLPASGGGRGAWSVVSSGAGLRLSQRAGPGAVRLAGPQRVRLLEPLMIHATSLRVWHDDLAGTSAWEVSTPAGTLFLMLSPDPMRGFSGEGQMLERLATPGYQAAVPIVQAQLAWQARIDEAELAAKTGLDRSRVRSALAALGTRGLAGYDATAGSYFHRELPFDLGDVERMQPRLRAARRLLETGGVRSDGWANGETHLLVRGTGVDHFVRLANDRDAAVDRCSCPWFSRYQGQRGPCKHILAARLHVSGLVEHSEPPP